MRGRSPDVRPVPLHLVQSHRRNEAEEPGVPDPLGPGTHSKNGRRRRTTVPSTPHVLCLRTHSECRRGSVPVIVGPSLPVRPLGDVVLRLTSHHESPSRSHPTTGIHQSSRQHRKRGWKREVRDWGHSPVTGTPISDLRRIMSPGTFLTRS